MKHAELELETFLATFMPAGAAGDFPSGLVAEIPPFNRTVLLGTAERSICEALVRTTLRLPTVATVADIVFILVHDLTEDS